MNKRKAILYATKFIENIPPQSLKKLSNMTNINLSYLSDAGNKDVISFIRANKLDVPENLARFMVMVQIEQIGAIQDGIYSIRRDHKNEWKSHLESAKAKFDYALNNPHLKDDELRAARHQVMDCISVFKTDIMEHINKIRSIDNLSESRFFITSIFNLNTVKEESRLAIETTKQLFKAYHILFTIVSHTQDDISSLMMGIDEDKNEILAGDNCLLMAAYCKQDSDKEYWYGLADLWESLKAELCECMEIFKDEEEAGTSFWDDDIENIDLDSVIWKG